MHFKYYAEVRDTQNVKRQVPECLLTLWKEVCFIVYPASRLLGCGVCVHLLFSSSNTCLSRGRCQAYLFACGFFFLATPSRSAYGLREDTGSSLFFYWEPFLVHSHWRPIAVGPKWTLMVEVCGSSQRCVCNGSATQSLEDVCWDSFTSRQCHAHAHCCVLPGSSGVHLCPWHGAFCGVYKADIC